jgi:hypothetical protein
MERAPIDSYEAQKSPRYQRDYEPVAHRCWRAAASLPLLCHMIFLFDFENEQVLGLVAVAGGSLGKQVRDYL